MNEDRQRNDAGMNDRGAALATTAILIVAFLALAVVGVDIGHLAFTATEVQTGAEIAATAGATELIETLTAGQPNGKAHALAVRGAEKVLEQNRIGASQLMPGNHCQSDGPPVELGKYQLCLESGNFDFAAHRFRPSLEPYNSVRATVTAKVPNIVAGIWPGNETSTVTKVAVAGLQSIAVGMVDLPFMVGDCHVPEEIDCNKPSEVTLEVPNSQRDTGWTNWNPDTSHLKIVDFSDDFGADPETNLIEADTTGDGLVDVVSYWLPTEWCARHAPMMGKDVCGGGGGGGPPEVEVGDTYQLLDKEAKQSSWMLGDAVVNHDRDTFRIPIMSCVYASTKHEAKITGFATIRIDKNDIQRPDWDQKRWKFSFICNAENPSPPGGGSFATGFVSLLQ